MNDALQDGVHETTFFVVIFVEIITLFCSNKFPLRFLPHEILNFHIFLLAHCGECVARQSRESKQKVANKFLSR